MVPVVPEGFVPQSVIPEEEESSRNVMGWTIFHDRKRGRYKAVKRVGCKVKSIYIGKTYDPELVRAKITAWEKGQTEGCPRPRS
jgi:hypothetical protein